MYNAVTTIFLMAGLLGAGVNMTRAAEAEAAGVIHVSLNDLTIEGGDRAPASFELLEVDANTGEPAMARFTLKNAKSYNALRLSSKLDIDAQTYNTITFKVKVELPEDQVFNMGVRMADRRGGWVGTYMSKHLKKLENGKTLDADGWQTFEWDVVNQPDIVRGMDMAAVTRLSLHPQFAKVPEDGEHRFLIKEVKYLSGQSVKAGDPELFKKWQAKLADYEPDYSDSSRYLEPPLSGRLAYALKLVADRQAMAQIILPPQSASPVQMAAKELQHWIHAITGAQLPVNETRDARTSTAIHLGAEPARSFFASDLQALAGTDGYAVRTQGSDIHIFGATDKGTLNGVYAFLENNTDLIWPRPRQELGAVYSQQPSLDIVWANAISIPATQLRGWATNNGQRPPHEIWANRNKLNYPTGGGTDKDGAARRRAAGNYVEFGGGHNLHAWIGDDATRFYPTIDGKKPEKLNIWKHQICFTHPELPAVYIKNLLEYIKTKTPVDIDCMNVKIEDNWGVCTCEQCLAPITLPDGRVIEKNNPAFRSTQFFMFLNQVTQGVNKVYPNLHIGTYAYFFTATPPAVEVDDNIRIYFCPYVRKDQRSPLSAPINDHWWRMLTSWAKKSNNVVIREYYGIMSGFRPLADVIAFDVQSYNKLGVKQYTSELNPDENFLWRDGVVRGGGREWDFMAMDYWIVNRIYWDDTQDVQQLRKYYLRRTYREAAPAMERFFGEIHTAWYASDQPSDFEELTGMAKSMLLGQGMADSLRSHLDDASRLVKHPVSRMLVDVLRERFEQSIEFAQDREKAASFNAKNTQVVLDYGWGSANRWSSTQAAWTASTYLNIDGKTVPAVRVNLEPALAKPNQPVGVVNGFVKTLSWGDTLSMTVRKDPAASGDSPVKVKLEVRDKRGHPHAAPDDAYVTLPDGSVRVTWTLQPPAEGQKAWSLEDTRGLSLAFDFDDTQARDSHVFYLTDYSLQQNLVSSILE